MKARNWLVAIFLFTVAVIVFWPWFGPGFISHGDWWHNLPGRTSELFSDFLIWDGASQLGAPLGVVAPISSLIYWLVWSLSFLQEVLAVPTSISIRLAWYLPYIIFAFAGSAYLGWVLTKRRFAVLLTGLLYPLSTFGLLTVQGGQMTVGVAYAIAPLVLAFFIRLLQTGERRFAWALALATVGQTIYDLRLTYITAIALVIVLFFWWLLNRSRQFWRSRFSGLLLTAVAVVGLLAYFWLPLLFGDRPGSSFLTGHLSDYWLKALSYVRLPAALAANHVWWPGSDGLQHGIEPLFFIIPFLAAVGLFSFRRYPLVVATSFIWLTGAFLVKGVNPPAGGVYEWLFNNFPGFFAFRDPAKFFTLLMLGLAPAAAIGGLTLLDRLRLVWRPLFAVILLTLLLVPLGDYVLRERRETFVTKTMPAVYEAYNARPFEPWARTLWFPVAQRYIEARQPRPVVDAKRLIEENWPWLLRSEGFAALPDFWTHPYTPWLLDKTGVSRVGLPVDTEDEIYRYFGKKDTFEKLLDKQSWLQREESEALAPILYLNEGVAGQVYTASTIVSVSEELLVERSGLPILDDQSDALEVLATGQAPHENDRNRLAVVVLNSNQEKGYGQWHFDLASDFSGTLLLDSALAGQSLLLDGRPVNGRTAAEGVALSGLNLSSGRHSISTDSAVLTGRAVLAGQPDWADCDPFIRPGFGALLTTQPEVVIGTTPNLEPGCVTFTTNNLSPGVYRLRLTGSSPEGAAVTVSVIEADSVISSQNWLPTAANFQRELLITLRRSTLSVTLQVNPVEAEPGIMQPASLTLRDLRLEALAVDEPRWVALTPAEPPATTEPPAILDVYRPTPREYRVQVAASEQPYILVLNQQYQPGWRLVGEEENVAFPLNGGLAAWVMPAGSAREVTLRYGRLTPYYLGLAITVATLGVLLVALSRKQKNR